MMKSASGGQTSTPSDFATPPNGMTSSGIACAGSVDILGTQEVDFTVKASCQIGSMAMGSDDLRMGYGRNWVDPVGRTDLARPCGGERNRGWGQQRSATDDGQSRRRSGAAQR